MKYEILIALTTIFVQRYVIRMDMEASAVKVRTADSTKKKTLQNPKQKQTPYTENSAHHCRSFSMKHRAIHVLATIYLVIIFIIILLLQHMQDLIYHNYHVTVAFWNRHALNRNEGLQIMHDIKR
jgi:hypothetical protein